MQYLLISIAAFFTSGLTLFSGFGLGTLLLPFFAIFFPLDLAVTMTAIVHFLNNVFKLCLLGKHAAVAVVLRFGIPAIVAAFLGAGVLVWLSGASPLLEYAIGGRVFKVTAMNVVIALLMIAFASLDLSPRWARVSIDRKYLPVGGLLSGFFGGLSGHQGALRAAFLIRLGLGKEAYIATGVVIACLVDLTRLSIYATHFASSGLRENGLLLAVVTLCAFGGAFLGNRLVKKITLRAIQVLVSVLLFLLALGIGAGLVG